MGQIIKIHDQVFEAPVQMTEQQRQAKEMGARWIGAKDPLPMPEMSRAAWDMRFQRRQREAARGAK